MKARFGMIAAILVLALVTAACSSTPSSPAPSGSTPSAPAPAVPQAGGTLRFAQGAADLQTLDPHYAATTQDRSVVDMVYSALVRFVPGNAPELEPDLASAMPTFEIVGGKQVWTFNLLQGVMCQPAAGIPAYELTSEDVIWSLHKAADKDRSAHAGAYSGTSFDAADKYTVKVTVDTPMSPSLFLPAYANYNGGFIICKQPGEKLGVDGLKTSTAGTGPFWLQDYKPKEKLFLAAHKEYFRGKPLLDGVEYLYMSDANSREIALRNGEVDVINAPSDEIWLRQMATIRGAKVDVFGPGEVVMIQFDTKKAPLDNLKVRQAIAHALSRDEFMALYGESIGERVYAPVPHFVLGGLNEQQVRAEGLAYDYDLVKAKQLLTEAGYPDGIDLGEMVTSEMVSYKKAYESMQAQLVKAGIRFSIRTVDHSSFHSLIRQQTNPMTVYIAFRPNAEVYLRQMHHGASIVMTGAQPNINFGNYNKVDALIDGARAETDAAKQLAFWKDAQLQILRDMSMYTAVTTAQTYVRTDKVDYGHELKTVFNLYPGITEKTRLLK
jgi:peptide/nickel transport system substrate-binding protein